MKKKLVVFDLDGTLLDTLPDIQKALNYALSPYEIPQVELGETRRLVGRGLRNALYGAVAESGVRIEDNDLALMYELLVSSYMRHPSENTYPYDGIPELLKHLDKEGIMVAIASNKKDEIVKRIVKDVLPFVHFTFVIGQKDEYPLKPDPEGILTEIGKLGLDRDDIVYVGDSEVDAETGKNAGCDYLIVNYGFRTERELEEKGITNTVDSPQILMTRLDSLFKQHSLEHR